MSHESIEQLEMITELHKRAIALYESVEAGDEFPILTFGGYQIAVYNKHIVVLDDCGREVYDWVVPSTHKNERQTRVNLELLPKALGVFRQLMILDDLAAV